MILIAFSELASNISLRAGNTTLPSGKSLVTIDPIPTKVSDPIVMKSLTAEFTPKKTTLSDCSVSRYHNMG